MKPQFCKDCDNLLPLSTPLMRYNDECSKEETTDWVTGSKGFMPCRKVRTDPTCGKFAGTEAKDE